MSIGVLVVVNVLSMETISDDVYKYISVQVNIYPDVTSRWL